MIPVAAVAYAQAGLRYEPCATEQAPLNSPSRTTSINTLIWLLPSPVLTCLQGKTFQCALAFKKLGISPIVMSAGELESGNAGEPAKLIRQRYRWDSGRVSLLI